jgi:hypothetical protein
MRVLQKPIGISRKRISTKFINAKIYGLDIMNKNDVWEGIKNNEKIAFY